MEKWKGPMSGERGTSVLTVGEGTPPSLIEWYGPLSTGYELR